MASGGVNSATDARELFLEQLRQAIRIAAKNAGVSQEALLNKHFPSFHLQKKNWFNKNLPIEKRNVSPDAMKRLCEKVFPGHLLQPHIDKLRDLYEATYFPILQDNDLRKANLRGPRQMPLRRAMGFVEKIAAESKISMSAITDLDAVLEITENSITKRLLENKTGEAAKYAWALHEVLSNEILYLNWQTASTRKVDVRAVPALVMVAATAEANDLRCMSQFSHAITDPGYFPNDALWGYVLAMLARQLDSDSAKAHANMMLFNVPTLAALGINGVGFEDVPEAPFNHFDIAALRLDTTNQSHPEHVSVMMGTLFAVEGIKRICLEESQYSEEELQVPLELLQEMSISERKFGTTRSTIARLLSIQLTLGQLNLKLARPGDAAENLTTALDILIDNQFVSVFRWADWYSLAACYFRFCGDVTAESYALLRIPVLYRAAGASEMAMTSEQSFVEKMGQSSTERGPTRLLSAQRLREFVAEEPPIIFRGKVTTPKRKQPKR